MAVAERVSQKLAIFYEQALIASASMRALQCVLTLAQSLTDADFEPAAAQAKPVVQELESVCAQYGPAENVWLQGENWCLAYG